MTIVGNIPQKPEAFDKLLQELCARHTTQSRQLFRMAREAKYFSNDTLLTELTRPEWLAIDKMHWDALVTDSQYSETAPLDMRLVLPKYLSRKVETAKYAGGNEKYQLVALQGQASKVFVEAKPFLTLHSRHPKASWRFSWGEEYWKRPVVLLERDGFQQGRLLGMLPTVPLRVDDDDGGYPGGPKLRQRTRQSAGWFYPLLTKEGATHVGTDQKAS